MDNLEKVLILDCTLRDGGYVNNWHFDLKVARETYRALSKSGIDIVEIGYHGTSKYFDPEKFGLFRFCSKETIDLVTRGINGSQLAIMVDFGKFDIGDLEQYKNTRVSLIRVAFHRNKLEEAFCVIDEIKKLGFKTSANLMGYTNYSDSEKNKAYNLIEKYKPDYVYFADTFGSFFPNDVEKFFCDIPKMEGVNFGFHPHNNLQMAFANSLVAIGSGCKVVDSSIYGMGRGAGNLPTEIILAYLQKFRPQKYNCIPILNIIEKIFSKLMLQNKWGYSIEYMISGIKSCHPDYVSQLIKMKEFDIEEIWNILTLIKSSSPIGFDKNLLENVLKNGIFGNVNILSKDESSKKESFSEDRKPAYINRHSGRDFLIIANGPSIKEYKLQIKEFVKKYNPIIMGANFIGDILIPHYHGFNNKRRFVDYVDTVNKDSKLLLGEYFDEKFISEYTSRPYEKIYYNDSKNAKFDIINGVINSNCRTIALLLAGVAVVMGGKRIFIVGLDGYMHISSNNNLHFYNENDEPQDKEILLDRHMGNLKYLTEIDQYIIEHGGEGIHILTPTDYSKFYKGFENYI